MSSNPELPTPQTRVCHNCHQLTPNAVPRCLECGAVNPEFLEEQEINRFIRTFFFRKALFSYIFLAINLFIFVLMMFAGSTTDPAVLMAFGAKQNDLIRNGEYWRLVTPMFLHIGLIHLGFNCYALWTLGPRIESLYGSARFVVIYIFTGIFSIYASYVASPNPSAGASGALFGLFGTLYVFALRYPNVIPPLLRKNMLSSLNSLLLINLVLTFILPVSASAHIGGLVAGGLAGWLIPYSPPREQKTPAGWIMGQVVALALVIASFGVLVWRYEGPRLSLHEFRAGSSLWFSEDSGGPVNRFVEAINTAERSFKEIQGRFETEELTPALREQFKTKNREAQEKLASAPRLEPGSEKLKEELMVVLKAQEQWLATGDHGQADELMKKFNQYDQNCRQWVETTGKRFSLVVDEEANK